MADVERALVSSAITGASFHDLLSRGIEPRLFSSTPSGQECAAVLEFATSYSREYGQSPSISAIQRRFPEWRGEFSPDPLEALADEFLDTVMQRHFDAKVLELSKVTSDRSNWRRLDEIMLDAARDLASTVPSGGVARFSAGMEQRIELYEAEKNSGVAPGIQLEIPIIDEVTGGVKPGWLVTTAGFSGLGKTTLALWGLLSSFEQDKVALMLSLEMSKQEVMDRLDTMVNHFPHRDLVRRQLGDVQFKNWRDVSRVYSKAHGEIVTVDKLGGCTLDRVHAEITRYKPDIVAIDYVQRMSGTRASMAKWEGLEEITNGLKTIAMDTDTTVLMVSQDGRSAAETGSTATSGANSISVYQAADIYLGLMQDESMYAASKMRVKMLKNRHGPKAEVDMMWKPATGEHGPYDGSHQFMKQELPS